jgi:phosphatidylglycerophosphate synthase
MEPLTKSIVKTLLLYCLVQCTGFFIFYRVWLFPLAFLFFFFAGQLVYYTGIFLFLVKSKPYFYNIHSGKQETVVNVANKITLFRITMLPFLVFLTLVSQKYRNESGNPLNTGPALTLVFALTFASDFFDGRVARTRKLESYIGKILDSASDYLLLGVCAIAFFCYNLLKPWLFLLIIIRLLFNALVMLTLFKVHKKLNPQTTYLGKTAIAVIMMLLVLEAAKPLGLPSWVSFLEPAAAIIIGVSLIDKLVYLIKGLQVKTA